MKIMLNIAPSAMRSLLSGVLCVAALFILAACSGNSFKVEGEITDAPDSPLVLQKADLTGVWIDVDSTRTDSNGKFSIKAEAPQAPELYRLAFDNAYVYLPIDSIETLTLTTTAKEFGRKFCLEGSDQARLMTDFQTRLAALPANNPDSLAAFKRWVLGNVVLGAQGHPTVMGYYAMTCRLPQGQLFDIDNPADARAFAAVATAYQQYRPDDSRTKTLEQMALKALRILNSAQGRKREIAAKESAIIDIELNDINGKPQRLSSITSNGKPTLLIFSLLGHDDAPALNREIASLYQKYGKAYNFYMVCLDNNITAWRQQAANLPWLCVIDPAGLKSQVAAVYNVRSLPVFYLYNAQGELVDRADNLAQLMPKLH